MLGAQHRLAGGLTGAGYATLTGAPYPLIALTAAVATVTAGGALSPDMDQSKWWRALPRFPGSKHRGLTHWWGLPVAALFAVPFIPGTARFVVVAFILGWASHLAGDALFGRVPLTPWGTFNVGLRFRTGGFVETVIVRAVMAGALIYLLGYLPLTR